MSTAQKPLAPATGVGCTDASLGGLLQFAPPPTLIQQDSKVSSVIHCFDADPNCIAVLAMDGDRFLNVLSREALAAQFTKPFFRELYHAKPVSRLLQDWDIAPLELPAATSINDSIAAALNRPATHRYEPVVVIKSDGTRSVLDLHFVLIQECRVLENTLAALERQREATAAVERERSQLHDRLVTASREAGRAEVATGVLHNVGNVLNSVNVSAAVITKTLQQSRLRNLARVVGLIKDQSANLGTFLTTDERGRQIPDYLQKLTELLGGEQAEVAEEMAEMVRCLEHIKQIVQMQQSHAKVAAVIEPVRPDDLIEDALRVNLSSFERHNVHIERAIEPTEPVALDKHKTLGILINLISNAKNALKNNDASDRRLGVVFERFTDAGKPCVRFVVTDNGVGIPTENLTRIFSHGFTTREEGHGFGLHSAANAAREMDGSLTASSGGLGSGATFTLELPEKQMEVFGHEIVKVPA